jgi:hypothetical protein
MIAEHDNLVVGLFRSQRQADAALDRLHRLGVQDKDVEVGAPEPGRYRIEYHESSTVWTAVRNGIASGAVVGVAISMGSMHFASRSRWGSCISWCPGSRLPA